MTARKAKPPVKDLVITIAITESPQGKLGINLQVPDHAEGTVALVLADAALMVMREMMRCAGHESDLQESRPQ